MAARAVAALAPNTARVVAVANDPAVSALGVEVRPDLEAGRGPLGGVLTALGWARELSLDGVFVLACDLPLVGAPLVRALIASWDGEDALVPVRPEGPEPLCALYATSLISTVEALLEATDASPRRLLERVRVRPFPIEWARAVTGLDDPFLNVNTPERRAAAEAALAGAAE
jgi:molybdopterin-guanine dinucleotide biosynthesis protein A